MQIRLLGPVDVIVDDAPRQIHGLRRKAVLAALALHGGDTVSTGRLVDIVWGGTAPATAVNTLQRHVSHLRDVLGSREAIRARSPGYFLHLDGDGTDVQLAEQLLRRGAQSPDPVRGARDLRTALALWRGPSLADLSDLDWFEEQAARLELLRLEIRRALLEARLAAGEHAQILPELEQMAADHPLDERIHGQLMLALYRCARQADALAVYRRLRRVLSEELGIDPGHRVRDLETAILRQDSALDTSAPPAVPAARSKVAPVPAQLPPAVPAFAGRAVELASLDAITAAARRADPAGPAAVVISAVSGTAGVGKTALAVHWAHRVARDYPDGQLYINLRSFDPSGPALDPGEAVRGFLEALGVPVQRIPAALPAQAALYRSLLSGKRVLVVLDNARDAAQVRPLLPGSPGCLVIVTSRNDLGSLVAIEGAHPLVLDLFTVEEARDLLTSRLGPVRMASEPGAADEIISGCARLPLALAVAAARASARPGFPLAELATELRQDSAALSALDGGDTVTDVRAVFSWSYRALSADAARLFRLLGLHSGPDISASAAASLAGTGRRQAITVLTELTRAHLLTEHAPGRYTFHDLLRAYAAERVRDQESEDSRRAAVHRVLDHYLHTGESAAQQTNPLRIPVPLAPPQPGVTRDELASDQHALAWFTAERPVMLATIAQSPAGFDAYTWQIASALGAFLERRGHWQDQEDAQAMALAAAQRQDDRTAQAVACRGLGLAYAGLGRFDDARTCYLRSLELATELGDHANQAHTHLSMAVLVGDQGRYGEALEHSRQSLRHYQAAGGRSGQASALNNISWYLAEHGDFDQALAYCQQSLAVVRELGNLNSEAHTTDTLGYIYRHLGHHRQAIACYQQALDLFRSTGDSYGEANCLSYLGDVYDDAGEVAAARHAWMQALNILSQLQHPDANQVRAKLQVRV